MTQTKDEAVPARGAASSMEAAGASAPSSPKDATGSVRRTALRGDTPVRNHTLGLTVSYNGAWNADCAGITVTEDVGGRATVIVDTDVISVSDAIAHLSQGMEVTDLSVSGATAEEMVVSLYKEFAI